MFFVNLILGTEISLVGRLCSKHNCVFVLPWRQDPSSPPTAPRDVEHNVLPLVQVEEAEEKRVLAAVSADFLGVSWFVLLPWSTVIGGFGLQFQNSHFSLHGFWG